ncbi:unnamed protein product, partial [Ectocarpus sp. 12 AP-2014]
ACVQRAYLSKQIGACQRQRGPCSREDALEFCARRPSPEQTGCVLRAVATRPHVLALYKSVSYRLVRRHLEYVLTRSCVTGPCSPRPA